MLPSLASFREESSIFAFSLASAGRCKACLSLADCGRRKQPDPARRARSRVVARRTSEVEAGLLLEVLEQPAHDPAIEVIAAKLGVSVGGQNLASAAPGPLDRF